MNNALNVQTIESKLCRFNIAAFGVEAIIDDVFGDDTLEDEPLILPGLFGVVAIICSYL